MSTRLGVLSLFTVLAATGCGGGGDSGPTGPSGAINVAGSYSGTGSITYQLEDDCDGVLVFGFETRDVEGDVRQTGSILDMDVTILPADNAGNAPIVCFFDGTLTGMNFSSTLRSCTAPPSLGADPTQSIACTSGSTWNATATGGFWSGSFSGGTHTGTVRVTFGLVNQATGASGGTFSIMRNLDMVRD